MDGPFLCIKGCLHMGTLVLGEMLSSQGQPVLSVASPLPASGASQGLIPRALWVYTVGTRQGLEERPLLAMRGPQPRVLSGA